MEAIKTYLSATYDFSISLFFIALILVIFRGFIRKKLAPQYFRTVAILLLIIWTLLFPCLIYWLVYAMAFLEPSGWMHSYGFKIIISFLVVGTAYFYYQDNEITKIEKLQNRNIVLLTAPDKGFSNIFFYINPAQMNLFLEVLADNVHVEKFSEGIQQLHINRKDITGKNLRVSLNNIHQECQKHGSSLFSKLGFRKAIRAKADIIALQFFFTFLENNAGFTDAEDKKWVQKQIYQLRDTIPYTTDYILQQMPDGVNDN